MVDTKQADTSLLGLDGNMMMSDHEEGSEAQAREDGEELLQTRDPKGPGAKHDRHELLLRTACNGCDRRCLNTVTCLRDAAAVRRARGTR